MGMSAGNTGLGELMRSYGLDGGVPVYRCPQTFPGILEQTQAPQAPQGSPYGQLSGMPTIRPYPFQDPRFQFNNLPLTQLRTKAPKVPRLPSPVKVSNKTPSRAAASRQNQQQTQQQTQPRPFRVKPGDR